MFEAFPLGSSTRWFTCRQYHTELRSQARHVPGLVALYMHAACVPVVDDAAAEGRSCLWSPCPRVIAQVKFWSPTIMRTAATTSSAFRLPVATPART